MKCASRALLAFAGLLFAIAGSAADADRAAKVPAAGGPPAFVVEIEGREIATLRATILGYSPSERAKNAGERLAATFEKNPFPRFSTRKVRDGVHVLADGVTMFLVVPGDVNAAAGETPESEATQALEALRLVRGQRAEKSDTESILRGVGLAVVATLVAILLGRLLFALDRRLGNVISSRVAARVGGLRVSGVSVLDQGYTLRLVRQLVSWMTWLLVAVLAYLWLNAVLESIPLTRAYGEKLTAALVDTTSAAGQAFLEALPGLVFVVVIFAVARFVSQVATFFFERIGEREESLSWLDRYTARPTRMITVMLIWVCAAAMAYPYVPGSDSRAFQGISVLLGLMVSLGASNIVGQAAAGLILMYTRAFRPGEYVRVQDIEGTVVHISLFMTRVETGLGDEVVLPNNFVLSNVSRNYSSYDEDTFTIMTGVTIGYDAAWRTVHELLEKAAKHTVGVLVEPPPRIFQTALSDFYVEYRMAVRSLEQDPAARADVASRLRANILDTFHEAGVQIMSPHYLGDPAKAKIAPSGQATGAAAPVA
jgi:small-conductance mechanosensitive channel